MTPNPRRSAVVCLGLAAALSLGTVGAAHAAPKKPVPAAAKVAATKVVATTVAAQVHLRVNPVEATPEPGDVVATVTVKAAPAKTAVTGTYELLDGGVVVGSGTLVGGAATVALDLEPGTHTLTATYSGAAKINRAGTKVVVVEVPVVEPPVDAPVDVPVVDGPVVGGPVVDAA